MKTCEQYEIDLSSLLDGELPAAEAAEALEHALGCAGCGSFFRAARRLQERAVTLRESAPFDRPAADPLWRAVQERVAGLPAAMPVVPPRFAAPRWLRAAALVALGLGGGFLLSRLSAAPATSLAGVPAAGVVATADTAPAAMNEKRFVALADELMRADVRYQRAMLEVLRLVPALETGEGLRRDNDEPRNFVRATTRDDRTNREL